jgi:hypothetical protein
MQILIEKLLLLLMQFDQFDMMILICSTSNMKNTVRKILDVQLPIKIEQTNCLIDQKTFALDILVVLFSNSVRQKKLARNFEKQMVKQKCEIPKQQKQTQLELKNCSFRGRE